MQSKMTGMKERPENDCVALGKAFILVVMQFVKAELEYGTTIPTLRERRSPGPG